MLRALGFMLKIATFSALILVLGSWVRWEGRTISDQVKTHLSQAERSDIFTDLKNWAGALFRDANKGASKNNSSIQISASESESDSDRIPASERQKLRALIRELNSGGSK